MSVDSSESCSVVDSAPVLFVLPQHIICGSPACPLQPPIEQVNRIVLRQQVDRIVLCQQVNRKLYFVNKSTELYHVNKSTEFYYVNKSTELYYDSRHHHQLTVPIYFHLELKYIIYCIIKPWLLKSHYTLESNDKTSVH